MIGLYLLAACGVLFGVACLYQQRTVEADRDHHRAEAERLKAERDDLSRQLAMSQHPSSQPNVRSITEAPSFGRIVSIISTNEVDRLFADTADDFNARFVLDEGAETVGGVE